jgi:superfamily II DNA helicase RecQ
VNFFERILHIHVKVLTVGFDRVKESFDSSFLDDFLKNVHLVTSSEYFFCEGSKHYISFVIKYELTGHSMASLKKSDFKQQLSEQSAGVFALLKDWRFQKAKSEGVPPYVVFSNNQLFAIANSRPQSLTDLAKINGVGESKLKKYGECVLRITSHDHKNH